MEITQIKIKVQTLNKSMFNQLESVKEWTDDQVIGWVNSPDPTLILKNEYQLTKVRWVDMWDYLYQKPENRMVPLDIARKNIEKYYHQFEQIILS
jgi:hypothetical protein